DRPRASGRLVPGDDHRGHRLPGADVPERRGPARRGGHRPPQHLDLADLLVRGSAAHAALADDGPRRRQRQVRREDLLHRHTKREIDMAQPRKAASSRKARASAAPGPMPAVVYAQASPRSIGGTSLFAAQELITQETALNFTSDED